MSPRDILVNVIYISFINLVRIHVCAILITASETCSYCLMVLGKSLSLFSSWTKRNLNNLTQTNFSVHTLIGISENFIIVLE